MQFYPYDNWFYEDTKVMLNAKIPLAAKISIQYQIVNTPEVGPPPTRNGDECPDPFKCAIKLWWTRETVLLKNLSELKMVFVFTLMDKLIFDFDTRAKVKQFLI